MASPIDTPTRRDFITLTEEMISPKDVGKLYQRAEALARLPIAAQQWIVSRAGGDPTIGFVVEPYCFFLSHEIVDEAAAASLLPPDYELVPSAIFADTTQRPCAIVGAFNVHTSVFWGSRVELYLIARNTRTGMKSWVICDYESNTISYDPGQGFSGATTSRSVVTTSHRGEVIVDVVSRERPNRLSCVADLREASMQPLDQPLWIEGNLSVDYGGRLLDPDSIPFGLVFDPGEMEQALQIPLEAVTIEAHTFGEGFLSPNPFEAACFPYAQHFLTTSFPEETPIRDREGLEEAVAAAVQPR